MGCLCYFPQLRGNPQLSQKKKLSLNFFFLISTDGLLTLVSQVHRPSETSTFMSAIGLRGTEAPTSQMQARGNRSPSEHSGRPGVGGCVLRLPGELVHFPSCCPCSSVCCDEGNGVLGGYKRGFWESGRWCSTKGVAPHTRGPRPDTSLLPAAGGLTPRVTTRRWKLTHGDQDVPGS